MRPPRPEPPDFAASQLFLRRLAFHLVRDEARAEDLVQETWATWIERRPSGLAEPRAWLARVLRNRAFNLKRADERRVRHEELAGRPDPSGPETDGTLEAQAQLLEALRRLEEPYRSTLVQRYYHDLPPSAIAERAGAPLDTVKSRLARGLEKLRAELDRRYHGDRRAWCHWLAVNGAPLSIASGPGGAATGGGVPAAVGSGTSWMAWLGVAAVLVTATLWKTTTQPTRPPEERRPGEPSPPPEPGESLAVGEETGRFPAASEPDAEDGSPASSRARTNAPLAATTPHAGEPPREAAPAAIDDGFSWPQFGGSADHDGPRPREDEIFTPRVSWFVPGAAGQPTIAGADLYTGGVALGRLERETGRIKGIAFERDGALVTGRTRDELFESFARLDPGQRKVLSEELPEELSSAAPTYAPAPVITSRLVLARRTADGGVTAFDRELTTLAWSWVPDRRTAVEPPWSAVPLCLATDELVLVAQKHLLVALRVADGQKAWGLGCTGDLLAVPASDGERAFFATDRGVLYGLELATQEFWRREGSSFGATPPIVIEKRVVVADLGGMQRWEVPAADELEGEANGSDCGHLRAFDARTGRELWRSEIDGFRVSSLGVGPRDTLVAGYGTEVGRFDLATGKRDERRRLRTNPHPYGSPTVVGKSLVFGSLDGSLYVHDLDSGALRWSFRVAGAKVFDFVHTGTRIHVSTSIGLFCLGDDASRAAVPPGFVLDFDGDVPELSFATEEKQEEK